MRRIYPPTELALDRGWECREALEPAFMQLVERAESAGWARDEIVRAVVVLAARSLEELEADSRLDGWYPSFGAGMPSA